MNKQDSIQPKFDMNDSYITEQDDCDEMSGYKRKSPRSNWSVIVAITVLFVLGWIMIGC